MVSNVKKTVSWAPKFRYWLDEYGDYILENTVTGDEYLAPTETDITILIREIQDCENAGNYLALGDRVKGLTALFGLEPCEACEARRQRLNQLLPRPSRLFRQLRRKK